MKKETKAAEKIARETFGFGLEDMGCDGCDFFDSDRGSISIRALREALEKAYLAGAASANKRRPG